MNIVELKGVSKIYKRFFKNGIKAVDNLTLGVKKGEIFGFLGPNGAGKTTTLKMLTGIIFPTAGTIRIFDKDVSDPAVKKKIGFLPETPNFYNHLTGSELLDFYAELFHLSRRYIKERKRKILEMVGLSDAASKKIGSYSKGMLQRIGIAQALLNNPEIILLDEPLAGLDPIGRKDIKETMYELKKQGKTIFFSTHILPDIEMVCDRVAILISGRLAVVDELHNLLGKKFQTFEIVFRFPDVDCKKVFPDKGCSFDKGLFTILSEGEEESEVIQKRIWENGGKVVQVMPQVKTLEEYFAEVVDKENEG
ncbi:MAG: hypothetical protein B5M53_05865 [Candidatus Cloacimonas sp. 4484_209]|nr:MAG: hypothetical protein B5M53_05865 [Candidatus Cloacimonas sp. 4484_209]